MLGANASRTSTVPLSLKDARLKDQGLPGGGGEENGWVSLPSVLRSAKSSFTAASNPQCCT